MSNPRNSERYAIDNFLRSLHRIKAYSRIPFCVPEETRLYIHSLLSLCDAPEKPLFDILFRSRSDDLDFTLLRAAIPEERLAPLLRLRAKHEKLQLEKEAALRDQDFDLAIDCLARQRDVLSLIAKLEPKPVTFTPEFVVVALRLLGYTQDIPDPPRDRA